MDTTDIVHQGAAAGSLAGLIQMGMLFVETGPGNSLATPARWFGAEYDTSGRIMGALLFIIIAAVGGVIFTWLQRDRVLTMTQSLRCGLIAGAIWFVFIMLGSIIRQTPLSAFNLIYFLALGLLYGLLLGNFSVTLPRRGGL